MKSIINSILKNNNINSNIIIYCIISMLLLYIIIFHVFVKLRNYNIIRKIDSICLLPCNNNICKKYTHKTRGSQYYLTNDMDAYSCIFTIWEASHIFLHIFIGYFLDLRYSLLIGIPFEIFENKQYNCENYMDIFYNTIGCIIGSYIRHNNT